MCAIALSVVEHSTGRSERVCCLQDRAKTIYLYPPPPGMIVWSGIHHIGGRHTYLFLSPRPLLVVQLGYRRQGRRALRRRYRHSSFAERVKTR